MGSYRNANHAILIERLEGILPSGQWQGKHFTLDHLCDGLENSKYGKEFVRFDIDGGPRRCYQYSGKNISEAKRQMDNMRDALKLT